MTSTTHLSSKSKSMDADATRALRRHGREWESVTYGRALRSRCPLARHAYFDSDMIMGLKSPIWNIIKRIDELP